MTLTRPFGIDAGFPNAVDFRKGFAGPVIREGVFPDPVTTAAAGIAYAGTGWGVNARPFVAAVKRGGAPFDLTYGPALIANDGLVNNAWTIGAAPGSGSRIDLLCIRARDVTQGDSAVGAPTDGPGGAARTSYGEFLVVAGVASGSPVAPAVPAGYLEVGRVTTPSGAVSTAGSTFTSAYSFAALAGGRAYFHTAADLTAWTTNLIDGQIAYALDTDIAYEWTGASWASREGGLYLIRPSSVVGGSIVNGSTVPTAGGTAVSINGVFSSRFKSYKLIINSITAANTGRYLRLRAAGVDYSGSNYNQRGVWQNGASLAVNNGDALTLASFTAPDATYSTMELLVTGMEAGGRKAIGGQVFNQSPIGFHFTSQSIAAVDANAYDGFTFYVPSSTFAAGGLISVYGLA